MNGRIPIRRPVALLLVIFALAGCSVKRMAVNKLGNALASGGSTFESDDDPDLVGEALPFSLKLVESLLAESPRHTGMLLAAISGFTEYSYADVGQPAERALSARLGTALPDSQYQYENLCGRRDLRQGCVDVQLPSEPDQIEAIRYSRHGILSDRGRNSAKP
jgi:hypothetical protein